MIALRNYYRYIPFLLIITIHFPTTAHLQQTGTLTVAAAASLTNAFTEIAQAFEETHPDTKILLNLAGSSTLAAQIEEGATPDIFASADNLQMRRVIESGRINQEDAQLFALNRLTLIVPYDNPAELESLFDLARPGISLVLAAPNVPVREYSEQMLESVAEQNATGFLDTVLLNLVSEESNTRQIVARIALGEAEAGIVYESDITPDVADSIIAIPIPDEFNQTAEYPIAPLNDTPNRELAQEFINFLHSEDGQMILVKWGFCVPNTEPIIELAPEKTEEPPDESSEAPLQSAPFCR